MTHYQELPQALMKEKHQGQTLTKEEVKVQTAHDLGVENVSKEEAKSMYKTMWDIRNFEENARHFFSIGQIPGFVHLYSGEEAIATGVCANLTDKDYITSTHRGHGHCVAKGGDLKKMMAEIFGKSTGLGKGKGGSMHIADLDKGILGANGMVGGGFGLATGAAMRNKYLKTDDVAVCFFGDGAANEGNFHECLNMASIWNLPVVFVNENNLLKNQHHNGTHQVHQQLLNVHKLTICLEFALMVKTYLLFIKWLKRPLNVRVVEMVQR